MPTYFLKPENALKRANEFIDVGKRERALEALYDLIKSKKHRAWQMTHEPIMEQYLELCVELRKSNVAKEGLYQYKNICQSNIVSLVNVVRKYIALAEEKTESARLQSKASVLDVDDLDAPESPESILLKVVSGEDTQARTDRTILMPWVKFLWESYRQCLDLLRNNSRVEGLYQEIAQQAFKFCLKFSRNTEFRKLCDNLRNHLQLVHRHQHQATAINLNNPESQALHLETRLIQLDSAIKMELWQEAFKAIEDIHSLIVLSKKSPKPSLMANYYQKLSLVFWKSGSYVFHACSLHKLFNLQRDQRKNITQAELQKMAARVLCATVSIPIQSAKNAIDQVLLLEESTLKKERQLSTLLMLNSPPSRSGLLQDLVKSNVLTYLPPELIDLYANIEVNFHPLTMYDVVKPSLDYILADDSLAQYTQSMEDVVIARLVKQVSQVYQTIEFSRLEELLPFATSYRLEQVVVNITKSLEMQIRINHSTKSLTFGTDLMVSQREDVAEGPFLQSMPSEAIRNQLSLMAKALRKAIDTIEPRQYKPEHIKMKDQIVNCYKASAEKDHMRLLQRRQIIEERKEQLEHYNTRKEEEEMKLEEVKRRKVEDAERQRREAEAEQRERQRLLDETENIRRRHAQDKMKELRQSELGVRVLKTLDESAFEDLTVEAILAKQVEQLEKEKRVMIDKLKAQEKKVDFTARAKRLVEIPLLQEDYEKQCVINKTTWEKREQERVVTVKQEQLNAKQSYERLSRMLTDKDTFLQQLKNTRKSTFKEKVAEFERNLNEERKKRLEERKMKRKEERRQKWLKEKEEAEQKKHDEQLKREREEKEAAEIMQREKEEREFVEREAREKEMNQPPPDTAPADDRRPGSKWQTPPPAGGWRDRMQNRKAMWSRGEGRPESDRPSPAWQSDRPPMSDITLPAKDWRKDQPVDDRTDWRGGSSDRLVDDKIDGTQNKSWRDNPVPERDEPKAWSGGRDRIRDDRPPLRDDKPPFHDERSTPRDDIKRDGRPPFRDGRSPPRESWRSDRPQPREDERSDWDRRGAPMRDERDRAPDDRQPRYRDERGSMPHDDRGPPPRDDRRRDEREPPFRDDRGMPPRDDRPIRDDRSIPGRDDRSLHMRDDRGPPPRNDRGPPNRDERPPLPRDARIPPSRDDRVPTLSENRDSPRRDERGPPLRDERGPPLRDDRRPPPRDDRGPPPREDRRPPPRDDRGPPLRDDRDPPRRDERGPPFREERGQPFRDDRESQSRMDKGPPLRDDRNMPLREERGQPRDSRGPPLRDDRDPPLRDDRRPPFRDDRLLPRGPQRDDRGPPPRDDRRVPMRDERPWRDDAPDGAWRRGGDDRDNRMRQDGPRDFTSGSRDSPRSEWRRDGPPSSFRDDRRAPPPRDMDRGRDDRGRDDAWRRSSDQHGPPEPRPLEPRPPPRDDDRRDSWRKGDARSDGRGDPSGASRPDPRPPPKAPRQEPSQTSGGDEEDDGGGWTTVRR